MDRSSFVWIIGHLCLLIQIWAWCQRQPLCTLPSPVREAVLVEKLENLEIPIFKKKWRK